MLTLPTLRPLRRHARLLASAGMAVALAAPLAAGAAAFTITPSGRADWDTAHMENTAPGGQTRNGSEVRRLWLGASGNAGALKYKAVADLTKLEHRFTRDNITFRDLWLSKQLGAGKLMVGQFKQAFSLEGYTSSDTGSFIERSGAIDALSPGFHKAVGWQMAGAHSTLAASIWQLQKIGAPELAGFGVGTRITLAPRREPGDVQHWGASLVHERHDHPGAHGAPALRIRPRVGAHLSKAMRPTLASFSAGRATDVDKWALEYASVSGAWSWQGEFSGGLMDDGTEHAQVLAEYGVLSWFASGHARRYDAASGRFGRVQGISADSLGWELAVRLEHVHGHQRDRWGIDHINTSTTSWTLASNWYLRPNLRLMLNLVTSFDHDHLTHSRSRDRELIGRAQFDF